MLVAVCGGLEFVVVCSCLLVRVKVGVMDRVTVRVKICADFLLAKVYHGRARNQDLQCTID